MNRVLGVAALAAAAAFSFYAGQLGVQRVAEPRIATAPESYPLTMGTYKGVGTGGAGGSSSIIYSVGAGGPTASTGQINGTLTADGTICFTENIGKGLVARTCTPMLQK